MCCLGADVSKEEDENTKAASAAASLEDVKDSAIETGKEDGTAEEEEISTSSKREFPPLPDEPKVGRSLLCRVAVRLPDGRRAQRSFLQTDPVQVSVACGSPKALYYPCTLLTST